MQDHAAVVAAPVAVAAALGGVVSWWRCQTLLQAAATQGHSLVAVPLVTAGGRVGWVGAWAGQTQLQGAAQMGHGGMVAVPEVPAACLGVGDPSLAARRGCMARGC